MRKLAVMSSAALVALLVTAGLAFNGAQADPRPGEPHVHANVECGSVELVFNNVGGVGAEEDAFFRYWVDGEPAGDRFEVADDDRVNVVVDFEEDTGDHLVEFRAWVDDDPTGPREGVVVESNCEPDVVLGTITIVKEANGAGNYAFDFIGDLGNFSLTDDGEIIFTNVPAGSYTVAEVDSEGWSLANISCIGSDFSDNDIVDSDVTVDLSAGDDAVCVFTNVRDAVPTATATQVVPPTATTVPPTPQVIIVDDDDEPDVIVVERPVGQPVTGTITPPNTGTAGIKAGWGSCSGTYYVYNYWLKRWVVVRCAP